MASAGAGEDVARLYEYAVDGLALGEELKVQARIKEGTQHKVVTEPCAHTSRTNMSLGLVRNTKLRDVLSTPGDLIWDCQVQP